VLKVLFVCVHNSARSQLAEELLRKKSLGKIEVESAGLEPGTLNPVVVDVLKGEDIDISQKQTKSVFELLRNGARFHYVVTVCDESNSERCPLFPGALQYIHWNFPDPSAFTGTYEEILEQTIEVKHQIEEKLDEFIKFVESSDGLLWKD